MSGSPRLLTVCRAGKALRKSICLLKNVLNLNLFFYTRADDTFKIILDCVFYNKNNLIKACLYRIVNRKIKNYLSVFPYRLKLL